MSAFVILHLHAVIIPLHDIENVLLPEIKWPAPSSSPHAVINQLLLLRVHAWKVSS
jgi:hypothetical protein